MNAVEPMRRPEESGRRMHARLAGALLAGVVVAACAGENAFTFAVQASLLGPQVEIIAPVPPVTVAPGDSVEVTANLTSGEGMTEVSWTGTLDAGGSAPFLPIVVPLAGVLDTTMSRFVKRADGSPAGQAKIIVTATDVTGDTGADTISVTLGS
jgi:hypothetical protein